ncbi:MAG: phosphoribosylaminoimidazolesuccinocarboxamide synthase [Nitriliruptorales bacterium]|nr:phosphoribosylaminoimidazolesuccinocarboxamide synthase [Nitriliruptorales bacterium]
MTTSLDIAPGVSRIGSGKVRELYAVGPYVLLVASDRISAFDVVLPTPIPDKGKVLTALTGFWLDHLRGTVPDHRLSTDVDDFPDVLAPFAERLRGRAMLCRRANVLPVECVVRGYLAGSAWKEYRVAGTVNGIGMPSGLVESAELAEPLFTPTTKASVGHDENLSFQQATRLIGEEVAERVRDLSLELYGRAREHARSRGLILADTKFEFGLVDGELTLIDEVLTPDSSRFWPADDYEPGRTQAAFDKQYVRDWLETLDWNKEPPGPELPDEVVASTRERYTSAYERLTGQSFAGWRG